VTSQRYSIAANTGSKLPPYYPPRPAKKCSLNPVLVGINTAQDRCILTPSQCVTRLQQGREGEVAHDNPSDSGGDGTGGLLLMTVLLYPFWVVFIVPALMWVLLSSVWNIYLFINALPEISWTRWSIAGLCVFAGVLVELLYLAALLAGKSYRARMKRAVVLGAPVFLAMGIIATPLFHGFIWLLSFIFPIEWLYLSAEGPLSIGQAIGSIVGLFLWPILCAAGIAKGVLIGGSATAETSCIAISNLAAAGVLDVSSLTSLVWQLVTIAANFKLLEALGFEMAPPFYSLNWWGTVSFAGYIEAGVEITSCYASGALNGIGR
jgi:hypothetical protein